MCRDFIPNSQEYQAQRILKRTPEKDINGQGLLRRLNAGLNIFVLIVLEFLLTSEDSKQLIHT